MIIEKEFTFDSAHFLPFVPLTHKCKRLHGHTYHLTVALKGGIDNEQGWVADFGDLKKAVAPLVEELDHRLLNAIEGLENPTAEVIANYIFKRLQKNLPQLYSVKVKETPFSSAICYAEEKE